jgi:hypothetical protein
MQMLKRNRRGQAQGRHRRADETALAPVADSANLHSIDPSDTDPAIDNWTDPHLVAFDPEAPPRNRLFLFFCGSYGIPARQSLITRLAARMGYHAINLCYPNAWTVGGLCRGSRDPHCHEQVRLQVFDGRPRSDLVYFAPANAITNRLTKLLAYLHARMPEQGWSRYLSEGAMDWSSMVVAGHSQGGGQAAIIGKTETVERVVMLAAPVDRGRADQPHAPWLGRAGATPASRYFGFLHRHDPGFDQIQIAWKALGMDAGGGLVSVDDVQPPYAASQRLVTDITEVHRGRYHGSVVQDRITPQDDWGRPLFEPVWRYLLGG